MRGARVIAAARRAVALFGAAVVLASCGGAGDGKVGSTGNADVPADWRPHKDPRGFELRLPPGWAVETKDELLITAGSPSTGEFVAISPFIAPAGTDPQECLQKAPGTFPSLFPQGPSRPCAPAPARERRRLR